jgi:5-methyltetrahydrofolate--homocysteine methyltransferase
VICFLHNSEDRAYELSLAASKLGREVADKSGREILVAGSIGPTGDIMGDAGWLSHNEAVQMFQVTAQGLMDGGADLIWVETISSPEEFIAASEAIENINAPWVGTMSFDTAGRTMMGVTSHDMSNLVKKMKYAPIGFGANCGVGASDLLRTVLGLNENADRPIIAKGNAGIPKYVDGHIHYDGTPEVMAEYAVLARACGATIIGGCCGTMPAHLKAMRRALDNYEVRDVPSLSEISKALGPFSSETDGTGDGPKPARVRRGQRR